MEVRPGQFNNATVVSVTTRPTIFSVQKVPFNLQQGEVGREGAVLTRQGYRRHK
ncbi:hypothetical protein ElyMa_004156300, partial [Elysia marginata]